ncbi:peptidyl-trna hydrolase [Cystoisospora suis]|uniref:Peptidyl-trna hydrolase n=1 Tax=Cystoisospora suis TaxID=483139 RepID=A0A2C6L707_9APIC|nr:peptidyl-trna hydrolase [Cystoisospora suis]
MPALEDRRVNTALRRDQLASAFVHFLVQTLCRAPSANSFAAGGMGERDDCCSDSHLWIPHSSCRATVCTAVPRLVLAKPWLCGDTIGESVGRVLDLFRVQAQSLVAVLGCTQLGVGQFVFEEGTISEKNSADSLGSVAEAVGTDAFLRLRFGLGRPNKKALLHKFYHEIFSEKERLVLARRVFPDAVEVVEKVLLRDNFGTRDSLRFRDGLPSETKRNRVAKQCNSRHNFLNRLHRHIRG